MFIHYNILLAGLLQHKSNFTTLQTRQQETVKLQIAITNADVARYLLLLIWYHNGSVIIPDERVTLSDQKKALTIANFTTSDAGVYKVQFNELFVHPHNGYCKEQLLSFLRNHPMLKPVVFCVNMGTDCPKDEISTGSRKIILRSVDTSFKMFGISLEAVGFVHSRKELQHSFFRWYRNGVYLTSSSPLLRHYQGLKLVQGLKESNATYDHSGRYEVQLNINVTAYLGTDCQPYYLNVNQGYGNYPFPTRDIIVVAREFIDIDYYRGNNGALPQVQFTHMLLCLSNLYNTSGLTFNLDADKQSATRSDGATLTCGASIEFPSLSMLSFIKNGVTVATTTDGLLQLNTMTVDGNPFGLHICQLNASGVTFQKSVFLKEQGI